MKFCGNLPNNLDSFWKEGETCWRTLIVSIPLMVFACGFTFVVFVCATHSTKVLKITELSLLDYARLSLCFLLALESPFHLIADPEWRSPLFHDMNSLLILLPYCLVASVVLNEAMHNKRESLGIKLLSLALWITHTLLFVLNDDFSAWTNSIAALRFICCFLLSCVVRPLAVLQDHERPLLSEEPPQSHQPPSPELTAGWFSLLTFSWMNSIMLHPKLTADDVFPLRKEDSCQVSSVHFSQALERDGTLIRAMVYSGALRPFFYAAPLKLTYDVLLFFAPSYLLREFIEFLATDKVPGTEWYTSRGVGLALALFAVAAFQTLVLQAYFQLVYRSAMRVRTGLVTVLYRKALRMSVTSVHPVSVVNLVATDVGRIQELFAYLHVIWSSPFQIVLCMFLLSREVGVVSALVSFLLIFLLVFGFTRLLAARTKSMNVLLMKSKDVRVKRTLELLNSVKLIKLYGMERLFQTRIEHARDNELLLLKRYVIWTSLGRVVSSVTPFIVLVSTLGCFVFLDGSLDPATAFVSVTLLQLLRFPMQMFPTLLSGLIEGLNSVKRIESYLSLPELPHIARTPSSIPLTSDSISCQAKGTFFWDALERNKVALDQVDFSVKEGECCLIRGSVGSGKTALLLALLGELMPHRDNREDETFIRGTVSYAAQIPWIRNASIRDNILFGLEYEESFYLQVLDAVCLLPDLALFPSGDLTDIGERGINLSGGQKARISLARCVYSRSDVVLLESVFEAVDEFVQGEIWRKCMFGLLKRVNSFSNRKRTVIVVTHCMKPETLQVDRIVVLHQGAVERVETIQSKILLSDEAPAFLVEDKSFIGGSDSAPAAAIMSIEESTTSEATSSSYALFLKGMGGRWVIGLQMTMALLKTSNDIAASRWLANWSNDVEKEREKDLWFYLGVYMAFAMLAVVLSTGLVISVFLSSLFASKRIHSQLLQTIVRAPMHFFDQTPLGRITQRFTKDLNSLDLILPPLLATLYTVSFDALGTVCVVTLVSPLFLFALPFMVVVYFSIKTIYVRTSRELRNLDSISLSPVLSQFGEASEGAVSIRAFGKSRAFVQENFVALNRNLAAYYLSNSANRWLAVRIEYIGNFLLLFAAMLAASKHGQVSAAMVGMALSFTMNITQSLNWVVRTSGDVETNIVSLERIHSYIQTIVPETDKVEEKGNALDLSHWPSKGEICFSQVCVGYRVDLPAVLHDVTFTIPPGTHVGCVGQTGCGKSTLLLVLLRILPVRSGVVSIDGVNIQHVSLDQLRNAISIIPQDAVMFQNTLRFNLDPGEHYGDDASLWRVLEICELAAFVKTTFSSLDAEVSGTEFSFGQRQLFCIARALLRRSKILLSDEASSGIDRVTDAKIQAMIRTEFRTVTTLTIAHRLESIFDSDMVLVLRAGRVEEFDAPSRLLEKTDSLFASLVSEMKKNDTNL